MEKVILEIIKLVSIKVKRRSVKVVDPVYTETKTTKKNRELSSNN